MAAEEGKVEGQEGKGEGKVEDGALVFDEWLKGQDEKVTAMLDGHVHGLKSALSSERENRKELEKQLRKLAEKSEKGSEAEAQLVKMADDLKGESRKADFYEAAHKEGVRNLKLAYTVAVADDLFDKHGRADFDEMKKLFPELFGSKANANAGAGTQKPPTPAQNMNDFIRKASGRK